MYCEVNTLRRYQKAREVWISARTLLGSRREPILRIISGGRDVKRTVSGEVEGGIGLCGLGVVNIGECRWPMLALTCGVTP